MSGSSPVTVAVRVRPFNKKEKAESAKKAVFIQGNEAIVSDAGEKRKFSFEYCFDAMGDSGSQVSIYEKLGRPLLHAALDGYNTCLFSYGQTGSGKSYTMMGSTEEKEGIIPRFCNEMLECVSSDERARYHIEMSWYEIYEEKIRDLLVYFSNQSNLKVRTDPKNGPYVEGLSKYVVTTVSDIRSWLRVGNRSRVTASTGMNKSSSRSHSVLTFNVTKTTTEELHGEHRHSIICSHINLVDLAGFEKSATAKTTGLRLKEATHFNTSILTLRRVISALSQQSKSLTVKKSVIPYRDSALTWLLKESLGGNYRTAMIATDSPASSNMEETLDTLSYAARARIIVNCVKIAEESPKKLEVEEIWQKQLISSENRKAQEIAELERAGVSVKVNNNTPNLVNLNEDPQLSELLIYVISHGVTRIGRKGGVGDCEIQLLSALVSDTHCEIMNEREVITITPSHSSAKTFVNGEWIHGPTQLHHGDRVVIGGDHFFGLNHPIEVQQRERFYTYNEAIKDFEYAKMELISAQSARIEKEIEEARLHERQRILKEIDDVRKDLLKEIEAAKNEVKTEVKSFLEGDAQKIEEQRKVVKDENLSLQTQVQTKNEILVMPQPLETQKNLEDISETVVTELGRERMKFSSEIDRIQKNLQRRESENWESKPVDSGNGSPVRIAIFIEEANKISASMKKDTVFSRYELEHGETRVQVENTRLGICTLWSMEKFEEKLEAMREYFLDYLSGSAMAPSDCGNLFYDQTDDWSLWSEIAGSGTQENVAQINPSTSKTFLRRRLSSVPILSAALRESIQRYETFRWQNKDSVKWLCTSLLTSDESFARYEPMSSTIDLLLSELNQIIISCENLREDFRAKMNATDAQAETSSNKMALQATLHLHGCFILATTLHGSKDYRSHPILQKSILDTLHHLRGELIQLMIQLMQGLEEEITYYVINESMQKIRLYVADASRYIGTMSVALGVKIDEENQHKG